MLVWLVVTKGLGRLLNAFPPCTPPCDTHIHLRAFPSPPPRFLALNTMSRRPELMSPPEMFYDATEARKYTQGTRMINIQTRLSRRAVQLLNLPGAATGGPVPPCLILDIGCGSALSGECLEKDGHQWIGMDISPDMLDVAVNRGATASCGDVAHGDMGQGFPFRPGMFDGCISISALQWLFYPAKKCHNPYKRLMCFFQSLYSVLHRGSRAVLQFYPENPQQMELAVRCATQCGFTGGLVVDYPHSTKAKKYYLTITAGTNHTYLAPHMTEQDEDESMTGESAGAGGAAAGKNRFAVSFEGRRKQSNTRRRGRKQRVAPKSRDWVLSKKDRQRRQGKQVRRDTKFSRRKRRDKF